MENNEEKIIKLPKSKKKRKEVAPKEPARKEEESTPKEEEEKIKPEGVKISKKAVKIKLPDKKPLPSLEKEPAKEVKPKEAEEKADEPSLVEKEEAFPPPSPAVSELEITEVAEKERSVTLEEEKAITCPKCKRENLPGAVFCSFCGTQLKKETRSSLGKLVIYGANGKEFKSIDLLTREVSIGRLDPISQIYPDIDLTAIDEDLVVSRRHAKIIQSEDGSYYIIDCESCNGTFLNREKLIPNRSYALKNNDEIFFARIRGIFLQ